MKVLITGGLGFIGSALARACHARGDEVVIIDSMTYAANHDSVPQHENLVLHCLDIRDQPGISSIFSKFQPDEVYHLAAESHVDRSIMQPKIFFETNVLGTQVMAECFKNYFESLSPEERAKKIFIHVSTDEVFGETNYPGPGFDEQSPYRPRSPYAASKAGSDHVINAYRITYNLPMLITNCCNNFGPWQNEEKFIPKAIRSLIENKPMPVFGDGRQVREWIYVDDHVSALMFIAREALKNPYLANGRIGQIVIGSDDDWQNIQLLSLLQQLMSKKMIIEHVEDRKAHDKCYLTNPSLLKRLGWRPAFYFKNALLRTIEWYIKQSFVKGGASFSCEMGGRND